MPESEVKVSRPAKLFWLRSNGPVVEACMSDKEGNVLFFPITPHWLGLYGAMLMEVIARSLKELRP